MVHLSTHSEILADRKADRQTYYMVLCFLFASLAVEASSDHTENMRAGAGNLLKSWVEAGTSHVIPALFILTIPFILTKAPLDREHWKSSVLWHVGACLLYSTVHIVGMAELRKAIYKPMFGEVYNLGLGDWHVWLYEFRKDVYTYCLLIVIYNWGRQVLQLKMELAAARDDAKQNHRLVLKSGGRSIFLHADDVIWAKAASNYVEVCTDNGTHLARMTLTNLKALLDASGPDHIQTHRSYIVRRNAIREIIPGGEGDAKLLLTNGDMVLVSRGHRQNLASHLLTST